MLQINTANERMQADKAVDLARALGYNVGDARPTSSFIRTEQAMSATANQYQFPIRVSDPGNSTYATQQLLQQQDIFQPQLIKNILSNICRIWISL